MAVLLLLLNIFVSSFAEAYYGPLQMEAMFQSKKPYQVQNSTVVDYDKSTGFVFFKQFNVVYREDNISYLRPYWKEDFSYIEGLLNSKKTVSAPLGFEKDRSAHFISDDLGTIRPDCTEKVLSYEQFIGLAQKSEIKSVPDFLEALPEGTLQKFTFVHDSQSAQKDKVDKSWPRVIRFSATGKLIMAYNCHPESNARDTIEVIHFDDKSEKFKFTHIDLKEPAHLRVTQPKSCLNCHGGADPRPNWNPYDKWPGVFGAHDDQIGRWFPKGEKEPASTYGESFVSTIGTKDGGAIALYQDGADYLAFRDYQKSNACYAKLPWPSEESLAYDIYPYIPFFKQMTYRQRPNAYLTVALTRLNARRMARKLMGDSRFQKLVYLQFMKGYGCYRIAGFPTEKMLDVGIQKVLPSYPDRDDYDLNYLLQISKALGIPGSDWNLFFNKSSPDQEYRYYMTGLWPTENMASQILFRQLAERDSAFVPYVREETFFSSAFGTNFQCLDDIATGHIPRDADIEPVCQLLYERQSSEFGSLFDFEAENLRFNKTTRASLVEMQSPQALGESVYKRCAECHEGSDAPSLKGAGAPRIDLVKSYTQVDSDGKCEMPMSGPCLSSAEQKAILNYLFNSN